MTAVHYYLINILVNISSRDEQLCSFWGQTTPVLTVIVWLWENEPFQLPFPRPYNGYNHGCNYPS